MEFEMYMGGLGIGKVIFDLNNIPFKKEGLMMGRLASSHRIQIDYEKIDKEDVFYQIFYKKPVPTNNDFWYFLDRYETYLEAKQVFDEVTKNKYFPAFRLIEIHAKVLKETIRE